MFDVDLAFPLGAGLVAAFNPCGFAMLPAYVSYFLGLESEDETNVTKNVVRGLIVGLTMTAGFLAVFGIIGVLTSTLISEGSISRNIGYATMTFGFLMVPLGIAMLRGFEPKLRLPRMQAGTGSSQLPSIFLFGVSYAVVSISCTIGIFLTVVVGGFTNEGVLDGTAVYLAYGAGMGLVIMVLTLGVALARNSIATNMRRFLPYVNKVSGAMLVVAGLYLLMFGWWEVQVLRGNTTDNPLVELGDRMQGRLTTWVNDVGTSRLALALTVVIVGVLTWALSASLSRRSDRLTLRGAFAIIYVFIELFRYEFNLLFLPVLRTIGDIPERMGNWFADPARWPVLFELMAALIVAVIVTFWVRRRLRDQDPTSGSEIHDPVGARA